MARKKKSSPTKGGTTVKSSNVKAAAVSKEEVPAVVPVDEFSSVVITIDHLTQIKGEVVQKFVASTEDETTAIMALFAYYKDNLQLSSPKTIQLFQLAATVDDHAFIYVTPDNTVQIIMNAVTFAALTAKYNSVLAATMNVSNWAGQMLSDAPEARSLYLFAFSEEGEVAEESTEAVEA